MTTDGVERWLRELGLAQYAALFHAHAIDAELLPTLTDGDLEAIGVRVLGHRKRLLRAIADLAPDQAAAVVASVEGGSRRDSTERTGIERRQITVMFVDLVGSTALSTALDPEELRALLHTYSSNVATEIARFEGHVAQYLGDGVLAYFGWPRAHEDDAERAIRAGLAVHAMLAELAGSSGRPLQARVGIATGLVVVGDLIDEGPGQRHTVIGETPNLAARLQALAAPGSVIVAAVTRELAGEWFVFRELAARRLKGVARPVDAFVVVAERPHASRYAARHSRRPNVLVGRAQELALLLERWRRAREGEGQAVLISGEAGIGKSRLVEAVIEAMRRERHFLVRCQCSPFHVDSPLYPVIEHLKRAAGLHRDLTDDERRQRLAEVLALGSADPAAALPLVAALLDLAPAVGDATPLTPQQRRQRTLTALVEQLAGLASRKPVLWIIEDAHWIDPTTLDLVCRAVDWTPSCRMLVVLTARPEFKAPFAAHPGVSHLIVNRLGREDSAALIAQTLATRGLPEAMLAEIALRTDGVPLFIEELSRMMLEAGALPAQPTAAVGQGGAQLTAIPTTLHDSLMARLDRSPRARELAQCAAVIGRSFDHRTLVELCGWSAHTLEPALRHLLEAELIFAHGTAPDATYAFKHALVRDAAYASLLNATRTALHATLTAILARQDGVPMELLARHADAGGLGERALEYWEQAGLRALTRSAYQEATIHFDNAIRACRALGNAPQWLRREQALQVQLGQALIANQGYSALATGEAFERALGLAAEVGDPSLEPPAVYGYLAFTYVSGRSTVNLAERFVALAALLDDSGARLVAERHLGMARFHAGRLHEALALYERALAGYDPAAHRGLATRYGQDNWVAVTAYLSILQWLLGWPERAAATAEQAWHTARNLRHPVSLAYALSQGVCITNMCLRRPRQVQEAARDCLELSAQLSLRLFAAFAHVYHGWSRVQLGDAAGCDELELGMREKRQMGAHRWEHFDHLLLADALTTTGRPSLTLTELERAHAAMSVGDDVVFAAEIERRLALSRMHRGGRSVEGELQHAMAIARRQGALALKLRIACDLARLWANSGARQRAHSVLAPVLAAFSEGFATPDLSEARTLLDQLEH